MTIKIIGTESLGVRGMCCLVTVGEREILIDPGIALGYSRHGLLPHPYQIYIGGKIRQHILTAMKTATDVVFSHFHGDHVPLLRANPYQLSFAQLPDRFRTLRIWAHSREGLSSRMQHRVDDLTELLATNMKTAPGCSESLLSFSDPVPHGQAESKFGTVMMTRISLGEQIFVHASDIQLLNNTTIETILNWEPDIVFASGPPLYLQNLTELQRQRASENGLQLAKNVNTLILDHHLLRSKEGLNWLENMSQIVGKKIYCAADFMDKPRLLLEARRMELYKKMPIPDNWHKSYESGEFNRWTFSDPNFSIE